MRHFQRHELTRVFGGETASPVCRTARRVNLSGWNKFRNIPEDARKYAANQAIFEEEALRCGMAEKAKKFVENGPEVYTTAMSIAQ